jgi:gluconate 2-dehydrogenase gamma chain
MESRRETLKIIGAISASCAFPFSADELFGQEHVHPAPSGPVPPAGPFTPKFFTESEIQLISRISDLIIPATDTPGALAAGVPQYIDSVAAANPTMQHQIRAGLPLFGPDFLSQTEAEQIAVLRPLSDSLDAHQGDTHQGDANPVPADNSPAQIFQILKNLTCDGYYTSQIGLVQELGYSGNTARESFPGCTHSDLHEGQVHEH